MSRTPILTRSDRAARHRRLVSEYLAGASTYDLAERYGLNRSHISYVMRLYGVVRKPGRRWPQRKAA